MTDTFVNDAEVGGQKQNLTGPVIPSSGAKTESVLQPQTNFLQDTDALQKSLVGPAQDAKRDQGYADRTLDDRAEEGRARMDQAWRQERARADDPALRPWNADQERANRTHGPMEQFGSIGMIFAMAASAFTRAPMTSALNAGAAAMTAIQQGDEKAYKSAYEAWKSNSDLALKRFDVEHTLYADADKLMSVDMNQWRNKTLQIATQFHDTKKIVMLNAGYDPEVVQARSAMIDSAEKMRKAREGMIEFNMQQERISEGFQALKNANPTWFDKDPTKITMEEVKAKYELIDQVKKSMKGQSIESPEQRFERTMALEKVREEFRASEGEKNRAASFERIMTTIGGRQKLAEMTDDRLRDLAGDNAELRTKLQQEQIKAKAEEGDKKRGSALERAKFSQEGREKLATMNISSREKIQEYAEGGRMKRAEDSAEMHREIAQMNSKDRKEIEASRETVLKDRAEIIFKGRMDQRKVGPATDAVHKANEEAEQKAEKGDFGTPPDLTAKHDWEAKRSQQIIGEGKFFPIDQSIIGELKNYPGKDRSDLSFIDKPMQTKLESSFTSRDNLERIAKYTKENPDTIGYIAELEKRINLDKYQDLFNKANAGDKNAQAQAVAAVNSEFDKLADGRLTATQASRAKILNKMLTTQAFSDAAIAGSRGGTIYLDRAFREIYDQASSPAAFYGTLKERYIDANNFADKYGLGFSDRADKDKQPFWEQFASPNRKAGAKPTATAIGPGGKRLGLINGEWVPIP